MVTLSDCRESRHHAVRVGRVGVVGSPVSIDIDERVGVSGVWRAQPPVASGKTSIQRKTYCSIKLVTPDIFHGHFS